MTITACTPCQTCCISTVTKKPVERIPLLLPWAQQLHQYGGSWTLKKVSYTVKTVTGTATTPAQYDPNSTYANGAAVAFGGKTYTASGSVAKNTPPLPTNASWVAGDDNPNLFVVLDADSVLKQWVDARQVITYALVEGGEHDTDYRVEVLATFRDCENTCEIQLWNCVLVKVARCE